MGKPGFRVIKRPLGHSGAGGPRGIKDTPFTDQEPVPPLKTWTEVPIHLELRVWGTCALPVLGQSAGGVVWVEQKVGQGGRLNSLCRTRCKQGSLRSGGDGESQEAIEPWGVVPGFVGVMEQGSVFAELGLNIADDLVAT